MLQRVRISIASLALVLMAGCGDFTTGDGGGSSPVPNGLLIKQASFTASGGVEGVASIYRQAAGSFILRLSSFEAPSSTNRARINGGSGIVLNSQLGFTSGAKNFSYTASDSETYISVEIVDGTTPISTAIFP